MLKKMKRREALEICNHLQNSFMDVRNTKFAYALQKNIRVAKPITDELDKISMPSEKFKEFEEKRMKLCETFAQKDKDGKPITENGHFAMGDRKEAFDKEYQKLRFAFGSALKEREAQIKKVQGMLEDEIEIDFLGIKESGLPENLTIQQLEILEPILMEG